MQEPADRLIAAAAKREFAPLGLARKGRSRTWIDDHGWWLINVEFQPSSHAKGCYLNVGEQHLWVMRDHLVLENVERPLGGSAFVTFDGSEAEFAKAMQRVATTAADAIRRRRTEHGDGAVALRRLADDTDDLNGGIAAALLGDMQRARTRLGRQVHTAYRDQADSYLNLDGSAARHHASAVVAKARQAVRLPPAPDPTW